MSTITTSLPTSSNPIEAARLALIKNLLARKPLKGFGSFPCAADFEALKIEMCEVVAIFDDWLAEIGAEVRDNANCHIDNDLFCGSFMTAIAGNETFALECCAEELPSRRRSA